MPRLRGLARRRVLLEIIELCRRHVMECAEQLGLTPESHSEITRYLETPEGCDAHRELKKSFEETRRKPADRRQARAAQIAYGREVERSWNCRTSIRFKKKRGKVAHDKMVEVQQELAGVEREISKSSLQETIAR